MLMGKDNYSDKSTTTIRKRIRAIYLLVIPLLVLCAISISHMPPFRANAEMYIQKLGNVDSLTLTVQDQAAFQKIVDAIYHNAMSVVMMVIMGLMVLCIVLTLSFEDMKI